MSARSRHWPVIWFLAGAAICTVVGLLNALGPSLVWFFLALVLDGVALALFLRRRA